MKPAKYIKKRILNEMNIVKNNYIGGGGKNKGIYSLKVHCRLFNNLFTHGNIIS